MGYIIQSVNENAVLEIVQDGLHFSASPVPHLRHLRHVPVKCLILRQLFKSTNDNAVLQCYFILLLMEAAHIEPREEKIKKKNQ